ncbi:PEGA domain-containing protein [Pseudodesulfovibrio cashew]|uniref:PEGA domain-containing protein n=1 Tax=Pseudodesulfovibrio cashew TaxID=2678688 RepID=A0A6I6JS86_9BACT|nr:PEGA domain-containing protein [Pseudodesulfovibrio cashew]QGY40414.1 PEGA domain-containing protein [Pseudodesulfovibrio cashew]
MNRISVLIILLATAALTLAGCKAATQTIPVSSNPTGAMVLSDGAQACITPCSVELEKTQAHILTLQKAGFRQVDVQISRKYDTARATRGAVQTGMWQKSVGGNDQAAVSNALLNMETAEESGDAYVLSPSSVVVEMVPDKPVKQVSQAEGSGAPVVISPDQLDAADREQINKQAVPTISSDQLAPEDRQRVETISPDQLAPEDRARIKTTEPATMGSAAEENPVKTAEEVLEGAAVAAPSVGTKKEWSHSSSSGHFNKDGSYSGSSTKTSTSVGVSVNPVEAGLGVLHLLEGAEKPGTNQESGESGE